MRGTLKICWSKIDILKCFFDQNHIFVLNGLKKENFNDRTIFHLLMKKTHFYKNYNIPCQGHDNKYWFDVPKFRYNLFQKRLAIVLTKKMHLYC